MYDVAKVHMSARKDVSNRQKLTNEKLIFISSFMQKSSYDKLPARRNVVSCLYHRGQYSEAGVTLLVNIPPC